MMNISKTKKPICVGVMSVMMSHVPNVVLAEEILSKKNEMISTETLLASETRAEAEQQVNDYLQKADVRSELLKQGVSPDEVSSRLASLSEQEIRQLSSQIKSAQAGGDILVTILLVVLIIYLIKRI
ncbi:MAG: PA2779 family protein [Pseudobdellovibrio sp.]